MDAIVAQIIGGYRTALGMYEGTLGPTNAKLRQAQALFAELEKLAERSADVAAFTTGAADKLGRVGMLIGELASEKPAPPSASSSNVPPAVAQAAAGYHAAFASVRGQPHLPETRKVYERVFAIEAASATPVAFQRALAEEGLLVAMARVPAIENAQNQLEGARGLSLPVMARCHETLVERLGTAKSAQEVEHEATHAAELSEIESAWDATFLAHATALFAALTSWMWVKDEAHRQAVEDAARFTGDWLGKDLETLLAVPRVADHFDKILARGVAGHATANDLRDALRAALELCMRGRPPVVVGPPIELVFWGRKTSLDALLPVYASAPRP